MKIFKDCKGPINMEKYRFESGLIWLEKNISGDEINCYYGFKDGNIDHAHVKIKESKITYWKDVSGLNPLIKSCGSIFL